MRTVRLVGAFITAVLLVTLAVALRLAAGPIALGPLAPWVEDAIAGLYPDAAISLDDASIAWNRTEGTLDLRLVSVRVLARDGRPIADLPDARLGIDIASLIDGEVRPTRLDVVGLALRVVRAADGSFGVGTHDGASPADEPTDRGEMLRQLLDESPDSPIAKLTHLRLIDVALTVEDRVLGRTFQAPHATVSLRRDQRGIEAELAAEVALNGSRPRLRASALFDRDSGRSVVQAVISEFRPGDLVAVAPGLAAVSGVNLPLTAQLQFRADLNGLTSPVTVVIEAAAGEVSLPTLELDTVQVTRLVAHGTVAQSLDRVRLDAAALDLDGLSLRMNGEAELHEGTLAGLDVVLNADPFTVATLKRLWPKAVGRDARAWIAENILAGSIRDTRARVRLTGAQLAGAEPIPADAVNLEWRVEGAEVRYFKPLPTVTAVGGTARMSAQRLDIAISEGRVGELTASQGTVVITGLDHKDQFADITITVAGPTARALELLDREPLRFVRRFGFEAAAAGGGSRTQARFKFPLAKSLSVDDLDVNASSDIMGFTYPQVVDRFRVSDGTMTLKVDRQQLTARGKLALNGVPVQLIWAEKFSGPLASRYDITGVLDDAAREALGLSTAPYIRGTFGADVAIEINRAGDVLADGALDLADATLTIAPLRWEKPPRMAAAAKFRVQAPKGKPIQVDSVEVKATDFLMRGRATIGPGVERRFEIATLKQGANDLSVVATANEQATIVELKGASADLRPHLNQIDGAKRPQTPGPPASPEPPTQVRFALDRVVLSDDVAIVGVQGHAEQRDDRLSQLVATGTVGDKGALEVNMVPVERGRRLTITSADAGAVVKGLGITKDVVGGTLSLHADLADDGAEDSRTRGTLRIEEFRLLRAPAIARVLSIAAVTGIGEMLSGEGVHFVRANIPFAMQDSKIRLDGARAWGPSMGLTAEGTIDRSNDTLLLTGTLVPAYAINAVLGNIPLLGQLLVGRKGEGVFGVTYRMSGPVGDPNVEINPLSALTPGFLRRIFEFPESQPAPKEAGPAPGEEQPK
ncbi:YhdP family protein [Desertibaculum subflavum]|uniref:YhdP family protein n=1 Tax=Desertibaculum subflavum TaxID=2268458 RepID=UPI000E66F7B6